jgi:glycosyltransferase involved in cell wall biosynthesis
MTGVIVHEWLEPRGGAEKVVDGILEAFPGSQLFALWNDAPERYQHVHESWLAKTPLRHHKAAALPLLPATWRHVVPPMDIDFALVSSHLFAHHVDVRNLRGERVPKFVYAHTPARYIWEPELDERGRNVAVRAASSVLKPLDRRRAQEATKVAANSEFVRERIRKTWQQDADVIYPPVDVETIQSVADWRNELRAQEQEQIGSLPEGFILGASRFVPYKRLDWVVRAGAELDIPVVIAGSGPEEQSLRGLSEELASKTTFIISPSTPMLYALYQQARVLVFPAVEDFGIMPVEAMACGTPVISANYGGTTETVVAGITGAWVERGERQEFKQALDSCETIDGNRLREEAIKYSKSRFVTEIFDWVRGGLTEQDGGPVGLGYGVER